MADKNQAVIDFLMECPQIADNPTYFNFTEAADNSKSILTVANDRVVESKYIDGSVLRRYSFTIIDFKSIIDQALPKIPGYSSENVEDFVDVQFILEWVEDQAGLGNYPDFGEDCIVDDMRAATNIPNLNGIDSNTKPNLAKYSISILIDYLDTSKCVWK